MELLKVRSDLGFRTGRQVSFPESRFPLHDYKR